MKKTVTLLTILLFLVSAIHAQGDNDFPAPSKADIPGAKILQQKYFDGNALWGHINGGADLYLEYGFDKLLFQEIDWNNINFRVEYYRMNDSEAALGIFSVSRFNCDITDTLTKFSCITPFQIQSALGRFNISIANNRGTKEAQELSFRLFQIILAKSNEILFDLPEPFNKSDLADYTGRLKLFKGIIGIQNGLPFWLERFEIFSGYKIIVVPIENTDGYVYFSRIVFDRTEERIRFMRTIGINPEPDRIHYKTRTNGITYIVKLISDKDIYFYESVLSEEVLKKLLNE